MKGGERMTELEYVIANFPGRLSAFCGKRIVLHGSRNYAEAIIDNFAGSFNFIGVMSLDPLDGGYFHGLKVVSASDLPGLDIDVVILTERIKYEINAFRSIRRVCQEHKIAIYNMYGLDEFSVHHEAENAKALSLPEAEHLCNRYDIIAFEVMDLIVGFSLGMTDVSLREYFYDLIAYLRKQGKILKFSLRKSFPSELQIEALKTCGLLLDEESEIIHRNGEDLSFRELREKAPGQKILYFGYGLANEFILPRCYGIDTCRFIADSDSLHMIPLKKEIKQEKKMVSFSLKRIKEQIAEKELISFDIFDTLLTRKTLYPRDVFRLVEKKAILEGCNAQGFASARIRAEEDQPAYDFNQIYDWLEDYFNWTGDITQKIRKLELDTEKEMLIPRTEVVELLRFAIEAGKKVVLTSDMYFSADILDRILNGCGISGYDKIFVSCDVKKSKHTGLYGELLRLCDDVEKILHIGDNPAADGSVCEAFGIDSIVIPSTIELARTRGWEKSIQTAASLMDRCLLGLIISKIFRDPFQNPNLAECSIEQKAWRFGNSVIGPLAAGHLTWLIRRIREENLAGVLFLARDGWLCYNIYQNIQQRFKLPESVYYYANRHAAFLGCADFRRENTEFINSGYLERMSAEEMLQCVYMIPREEILLRTEEENDTDYIERHMKWICKTAEKARKGYIRYSERHGLEPGNSYAVYDFISIGRTQHYLSKFLPFKLKGFNFWKYTSVQPIDSNVEYYLQGDNLLLMQTFIEYLEPFFSSSEPSQCCMSEQGEPNFMEEHRSMQELREVKSVLEAAEAFGKEFLRLFYQEGQSISPQLIEEIYASEEFYLAKPTIYDDWVGFPFSKRAEDEKEHNRNQ